MGVKSSTLLTATKTIGDCRECRHANHGTIDFGLGHPACQLDGKSKGLYEKCSIELQLPNAAGQPIEEWTKYFLFERHDGSNGTWGTLQDSRMLAEDADEELRRIMRADRPFIPAGANEPDTLPPRGGGDPTNRHAESADETEDEETRSLGEAREGSVQTLSHGGSPQGAETLSHLGGSSGGESTLTLTGGGGGGELVDKVDWEIGDIVDGKYEVTGELGRGGMGVVYKVHHREWDVDLAVKMPLANLREDETSRERFVREAQTWVDLGLHPNIVQCWYVRELGGVPRVFSDYVSGGSLKDWIREGKVRPGDWETILDLVIQACDGLGYAHERGVVHRDVKPANLLMAEDGRLCVTDFGLVSLRGTEEISQDDATIPSDELAPSLTMTGSMMGTPEYGAPEQWGAAKEVDARADIYALGVVLFELACGRRPFDDGSHTEPSHVLIGRHLGSPVPDPREFREDVSESLAALIVSCLAKKPEERPKSMGLLRGELAETYRELLGREYPRETPKAAEMRADALNNRAVSLWDLGKVEEAVDAWSEALGIDAHHPESIYNRGLVEWRGGKVDDLEVVRRLKDAKLVHRSAAVNLGLVHLERAAADEAERELREALEDPVIAQDGVVWRALGDACMAQEKHDEAAAAWEKTLELLPGDVLAERDLRLVGKRGGDSIRFPFSRRQGELWLQGTKGTGDMGVTALAMTPDARFALIASQEREGGYRDEPPKFVSRLELFDLGPFFADQSGNEDGGEKKDFLRELIGRRWAKEVRLREVERPPGGAMDRVDQVAITPNGRYGVEVGTSMFDDGCSMQCWDLDSGKLLHRWSPRRGGITALAVTSDGRFALTGWLGEGKHDGHRIVLLDLVTGEQVRVLRDQNDSLRVVTALAVSPDGMLAVSGGEDGEIHVWDLGAGKRLRVLEGHPEDWTEVKEYSARGRRVQVEKAIRSLTMTDDGRFVLSQTDRNMRFRSLETGESLRVFQGYGHKTGPVAMEGGGSFVLVGGDEHLRLIDLGTGVVRRTFDSVRSGVGILAVTPDGRYALSGGEKESETRIWAIDREARAAPIQTCRPRPHTEVVDDKHRFLDCLAKARTSFESGDFGDAWRFLSAAREVPGFERDEKALRMNAELSRHLPRSGLRGVALDSTLEPRGVKALAIEADGRHLVTRTTRALELTDLGASSTVSIPEYVLKVRSVALSQRGLVVEEVGESSWSPVPAPPPHAGPLQNTERTEWEVRVWDVDAGRILHRFRDEKPPDMIAPQSHPEVREGWRKRSHVQALIRNGEIALSTAFGVVLWDVTSGEIIREFAPTVRSSVAAISQDERLLATAIGGKLALWDIESGQWLRDFDGQGNEVSAVSFTPDGRYIVSGEGRYVWSAKNRAGSMLRLWNVTTGECELVMDARLAGFDYLSVTPDGRFALYAGKHKEVQVWDLRTGKLVRAFDASPTSLSAVALARDACLVVAAGGDAPSRKDGALRVWELDWALDGSEFEPGAEEIRSSIGESRRRFDEELELARAACDAGEVLRARDHIARARLEPGFASHADAIALLEQISQFASEKVAAEFRAIRKRVEAVDQIFLRELSRAMGTLAAGDSDRCHQLLVRARSIPGFEHDRRAVEAFSKLVRSFRRLPPSGIHEVKRISRSCRVSVAATRDGRIALVVDEYDAGVCDLDGRGRVRWFKEGAPPEFPRAGAISRGGRIAVSADDSGVHVWNVETDQCLQTFDTKKQLEAVALTNDGRCALFAFEYDLGLWDITDGKLIRTYELGAGTIRAIEVTPDSRLVLAASDQGLHVWEIATGRRTHQLSGREPLAMSSSEDGRFAVSAERDGIVRLWDLRSGSFVRKFEGNDRIPLSLAITPDNSFVLAVKIDGSVWVWDLNKGTVLRRFDIESILRCATFAADASLVVCADTRNTLMVWEVGWELGRLPSSRFLGGLRRLFGRSAGS